MAKLLMSMKKSPEGSDKEEKTHFVQRTARCPGEAVHTRMHRHVCQKFRQVPLWIGRPDNEEYTPEVWMFLTYLSERTYG